MMSVIDGWEVLDVLKEALGTLDLDTNLICCYTINNARR